tara:strand:- start:292 stop:678 length:387 start_codon:yes stop_codon:yes gene_type:complete
VPGRLPVDGRKVIEHRITLGGSERQALKDLALSYRVRAIAGDEGILDSLTDLDNVIGILATAGFILELTGITDIFDFDDTAKAKAMEIKDKIIENEKRAIENNEARAQAENDLVRAFLSRLTAVTRPR